MSHFKVKSKLKLHELEIGAEIPESDFASISGDFFVQLEYVADDDEKIEPYKVKPGIWSIAKQGGRLCLVPTSFTQDKLLPSFIHTQDITSRVDKFFSRIHIYKDFGIEVAKRCMLLYGPAGSGKSTGLAAVASKYSKEKDVAIIIWKTDVIDPYEVKEFVKAFDYIGVTRLIFIAEDIGGVEMDGIRIKSESSLLALLDNQEKAFTVPVMIICTTNYPENLLANLTNRPQRIDDKVEIGFPSGFERQELLKFFSGKTVPSNELIKKIGLNKYKEFTPSHIKEVFVRSAIYDIPLEETVDQLYKEIEHFKALFQNKVKLGITTQSDDY